MYDYIIIVLLVLIFIVLYLKEQRKKQENFAVGYGTTFGEFHKPIPNCEFNNNCFPGYYFRSQLYSNMCEPSCGLLKTKRNIRENCYRTLN
jgi:hypothetical protein